MKKPEDLAEEHWAYVRDTLRVHGEDDAVIEKIGWHYTTAMVHGYKHAIEDMKK